MAQNLGGVCCAFRIRVEFAVHLVELLQNRSNYLVLIVACLIVASGAAVLEILYLAYNGDKEISWSEACSSYGRFCSRMKLALVLHALALWCLIVLAVISAYRTFIMSEPPSLPSKEVEEEIT
ncbi:hypothetical protein I3760_09G166400 [Carya illinoinensis]|nr:hypothetical protein I3760_09G166400 [Carya illinoinensis]